MVLELWVLLKKLIVRQIDLNGSGCLPVEAVTAG
jgi:hypothetical protein